ncbi:hypothetical protein GJ496_007312 [Pomphorhynchus laevis]|nr:hypothetical protein GJ496_007312 [Pomphorhynchus laevis]
MNSTDIYPPSDDTFTLFDAVFQDLTGNERFVVELCIGSGYILKSLINKWSPEKQCYFLGLDISSHACQYALTECTSVTSKSTHVDIVQSDLLNCFNLISKVDAVICNPPYVVTSHEELVNASSDNISRSWAGGDNGREVILRIIDAVIPILTPESGRFYLLIVSENDPDFLINQIASRSDIRSCAIILSRKMMEHYFILRICRKL